ncbi:hypothetical protein N9L19_01280, partial [bacterium]|nr:hypothetical protein [bacterium]
MPCGQQEPAGTATCSSVEAKRGDLLASQQDLCWHTSKLGAEIEALKQSLAFVQQHLLKEQAQHMSNLGVEIEAIKQSLTVVPQHSLKVQAQEQEQDQGRPVQQKQAQENEHAEKPNMKNKLKDIEQQLATKADMKFVLKVTEQTGEQTIRQIGDKVVRALSDELQANKKALASEISTRTEEAADGQALFAAETQVRAEQHSSVQNLIAAEKTAREKLEAKHGELQRQHELEISASATQHASATERLVRLEQRLNAREKLEAKQDEPQRESVYEQLLKDLADNHDTMKRQHVCLKEQLDELEGKLHTEIANEASTRNTALFAAFTRLFGELADLRKYVQEAGANENSATDKLASKYD